MKERFENRKLDGGIKISTGDNKHWIGDKLNVVSNIIAIAKEYLSDGYVLTLRQLYYQLVARDIIPNHDKVYSKISSIKDDVVYSGLVDWKVFEDRGRIPSQAYFEHNVKGALTRTVDYYSLDRQREQKNHIEVWTEKDAISSILKRATNPKTIRLVVNKGYTSSTAIYGAYERFIEEIADGKKVKILYFGDHDPSGMDMIRDIEHRIMLMFTKGAQFDEQMGERVQKWWDKGEYTIYDICQMEGYESVGDIDSENNSDSKREKIYELFEEGQRKMFIEYEDLFEVIPVGLTMDQIKEYNPPHNPAKMTDPRAKGYIRIYGAVSWEVDALPPKIMLEIVNEAIDEYMDLEVFEKIKLQEQQEKGQIVKMIKSLDK
tara:strand:+ start:22109 stop:23233 length:1125 start_codon:yes stop_codon:yes gene_type:complete